jgi:hypothetical protein
VRLRLPAAVLVLVLAACTEDDGAAGESGEPMAWELPRECPPPEGVIAAPQSVDEVVALVNALPKPTTLPCYLQALPRPLALYATLSEFSAQPAGGQSDPRIFVFAGDLVQSVVPSGQGAALLELAHLTSETRSVKAEIEFPVEAQLAPGDPYDRIRVGAGTSCGVCHLSEFPSAAVQITTAYESEALQPRPDDALSNSLVRQYARDCDPEATPDRCGILTGLFAHGETIPGEFPASTKICLGFQ